MRVSFLLTTSIQPSVLWYTDAVLRIRMDPKLLTGSGTEINVLDPDSNPDPKPD
jgi:hypothetical protein